MIVTFIGAACAHSRQGYAAMLATLAAVLLATAAEAAEQRALHACYGVVTANGDNGQVRLMRVIGADPRVHFRRDRTEKAPVCPGAMPGCRLPDFVTPGDLVLAGPAMEEFACVQFRKAEVKRERGKRSSGLGFLPLSALEPVDASSPKLDDWTGTWQMSKDTQVWVTHYIPGQVKIGGWSSYGARRSPRDRKGDVDIGSLDGIAEVPAGNLLSVGDGYDGRSPPLRDGSDCKARLRLFGPYLIVEDNGGCGGPRISFTGVYARLGKTRME